MMLKYDREYVQKLCEDVLEVEDAYKDWIREYYQDLFSQLLQAYKNLKWYKKLFFHIPVDVTNEREHCMEGSQKVRKSYVQDFHSWKQEFETAQQLLNALENSSSDILDLDFKLVSNLINASNCMKDNTDE